MFQNTQNPNALDSSKVDLVGGYRIFVPATNTPFYDAATKKPIHLGHVRAPTETFTPTTKEIESGVYGRLVTVLEVLSKTVESGTFESISVKDLTIRGLWAGSKAVQGGAPAAAPFQASHAYALNDLVVPTTSNGHYYKVTTAGTSGANEPGSYDTAGGTTTSGAATFTDQGLISAGPAVIVNNHDTVGGMLIDVIQSALAGRSPEISVLPNVTLRGDGYGGGRNSTDETSLKFAYTVLAPSPSYAIPAAVLGTGAQTATLKGGYDILNVPVGGEDAIIQALISGYYTP